MEQEAPDELVGAERHCAVPRLPAAAIILVAEGHAALILLDVESDLRGTLRNFGLKVAVVGGSRYEARIRELVADFPRLAAIVEALLSVRRVMRQQLTVLHKMLLDMVRGDPVCRMTVPGVGEAAT